MPIPHVLLLLLLLLLTHSTLQPLKCGHAYHHGCLKEHILVYIKERRGVVDCPDCRASSGSSTSSSGKDQLGVLSEDDVRDHVDPPDFEQYQR